ncbi:hypothetical protein RB195_004686 [Necator americanus]|uniref:Innexin n=1 Tax=Necator americanus TaxID=51031 RepID=A0ABR1BJ88_NECAM
MVFAEIVGTLSFLHPQADDDISDRLHYYYTTTFLLLTAVLISIKMFGGRPIECWLPAEYKSSWEDYTGIRLKDIMSFANDKSNVQPASRRANINGLAMHLSSVFKHRFRFGSTHPYHHRFIARRLELADISFKQRNFTLELDEFVRDYVKMDGVFVLRMITIHSGVLICTEVVDTMWDQFLAEQGHKVITALLGEHPVKEEYKDERSPSAGGQSMEIPTRRKTSVLVPLMSREDLTQITDHMLRPPSGM